MLSKIVSFDWLSGCGVPSLSGNAIALSDDEHAFSDLWKTWVKGVLGSCAAGHSK